MLLSSRVCKGLNELGMLSHEASIIATKERGRNENDRVFDTKKIVVDGARHLITTRPEP